MLGPHAPAIACRADSGSAVSAEPVTIMSAHIVRCHLPAARPLRRAIVPKRVSEAGDEWEGLRYGGRTRQDFAQGRDAMGDVLRCGGEAAWIPVVHLDADAVSRRAHGIRLLAKAPGFTVVALLVFAPASATSDRHPPMRWFRIAQITRERVLTLWERNRATESA